MKILNLGCGAERPQGKEWTNLDDLHAQLPAGEGARDNLDKETNYVNFDVMSGPLPFEADTFDGILASHFFEHFDAQQAVATMEDCRRILKPGGALLVSVPDAGYFRKVYSRDRNENWVELFDTHDPGNTWPTFFRAALWFEQHKVLLTEDSLWCYFVRSGFNTVGIIRPISTVSPETEVKQADCAEAFGKMLPLLNRRKFSVEMIGVK